MPTKTTTNEAAAGNARLYQVLCGVLDDLRAEAPASSALYHPPPSNGDALIQARSRSLLHLFLKSRFGVLAFQQRESFVTDGSNDGGIDAFYIDDQRKVIYLVQSKFRATAGNFASTNMTANDLLKMDVKRILSGELKNESGIPYNDRIKKNLQAAIRRLPDAAGYAREIVLIGNVANLSTAQLKRLVDGYHYEIYPSERIFQELLFPVITGTYYNDPKLLIKINLGNVRGAEAHLDYDAQTKSQKTNIKLIFVPTKEIGRVMMTYRNSILKFNPRSFLELDRNQVNREIEASIRNKSTNEFALFNNGITITTDNTKISQDTGRRGTAQLVLTNPQLVNGAQTAYTLCQIYESCIDSGNFGVFQGKEVLVKVITFVGTAPAKEVKERTFLVAAISKATNAQTKVDDYDRRSNDPLQMDLQKAFYEKFGLLYERKRGEFSDGLRNGYISRDLLVNRENLVRVSLACGFRVNQARAGISKFATEAELAVLLKLSDFPKYAYGYEVLNDLGSLCAGGRFDDVGV
ncbi:AIPR family protein [Granulicella tundricola]|uniref:Abortive phage infection n=1 Tax=Granulicella tundricola (strain ATCC BAA-1859 / DSM 23138 / MP5ACTX9) TaxID=1198114 RepID=E8WZW7_GRATM|nr:AIPR family protein [Granulicella tundricola]ADW67778.1 Abortive phage infection [Granulicella tundricola MP5ACTX9]